MMLYKQEGEYRDLVKLLVKYYLKAVLGTDKLLVSFEDSVVDLERLL